MKELTRRQGGFNLMLYNNEKPLSTTFIRLYYNNNNNNNK